MARPVTASPAGARDAGVRQRRGGGAVVQQAAASHTTSVRLDSVARPVVVIPIRSVRAPLYYVLGEPGQLSGTVERCGLDLAAIGNLSPNACLSLDDIVCAHRVVCALFAAEAGGRLRAARSCHCGACSPEPWTVVLVPCRASSPRTPNCRTGCRTILPWGTCSDPG